MKIPGNICFSKQIFYRKQFMGAPEQTSHAEVAYDGRKLFLGG